MPFLGPEGRKQLRRANRASSVGIELVLVSTLVGLFGGQWIDGQLGTEPWFMVIGLICGLIAGFRGLFSFVKHARKVELEGTDA